MQTCRLMKVQCKSLSTRVCTYFYINMSENVIVVRSHSNQIISWCNLYYKHKLQSCLRNLISAVSELIKTCFEGFAVTRGSTLQEKHKKVHPPTGQLAQLGAWKISTQNMCEKCSKPLKSEQKCQKLQKKGKQIWNFKKNKQKISTDSVYRVRCFFHLCELACFTFTIHLYQLSMSRCMRQSTPFKMTPKVHLTHQTKLTCMGIFGYLMSS